MGPGEASSTDVGPLISRQARPPAAPSSTRGGGGGRGGACVGAWVVGVTDGEGFGWEELEERDGG